MKRNYITANSATFLLSLSIGFACLLGCKSRTTTGNDGHGAKSYSASGVITRTDDYCGGVRPSEEKLEQMRAPHPANNIILLVRSGKTNLVGSPVLYRDTTDAQGKFQFQLPPGEYCMVLLEKENARNKNFFTQEFVEVDKNCDANWLTQCDLTFSVKDHNVEGLQFALHRRCLVNTWSPCAQWKGPLPP
jgi:hypothetical protein